MADPEELVHPGAAVAPGYLANRVARVFNRRVDAALRPHGVSLALLGPLLLLSWQGPMRQRDMVVASAVKQPAMVALIDKLEALALVTRAPAPGDRRAALVSLTARGRRLAVLGGEVLVDLNAQALQGFSAEEARLAVALLGRLVDNLEGAAAPG